MKKIFIGVLLGITFSAIGTVSPGSIIKSDLINKILDIKIQVEPTVFYLYTSTGGAVTYESPIDWISSTNCKTSTGNYTCNIKIPLVNKMICTASMAENGNGVVISTYEISNSSNTKLHYNAHYSSTNAYIDRQITLSCQKRGVDYENSFKTIRQIIEETGYVF